MEKNTARSDSNNDIQPLVAPAASITQPPRSFSSSFSSSSSSITVASLVNKKIALVVLSLTLVGTAWWSFSYHNHQLLTGSNGDKFHLNPDTNYGWMDTRTIDQGQKETKCQSLSMTGTDTNKNNKNKNKNMNCNSLLSATSNNNKKNKNYIQSMKIPKSTWTFLHVGKAGGGTIKGRTNQFWNFNVQQCHPHPCPQKQFQQWNQKLIKQLPKAQQQKQQKQQNQNLPPQLTISLRDPVDRFVSAYYWKRNYYCTPKGIYDNSVTAASGSTYISTTSAAAAASIIIANNRTSSTTTKAIGTNGDSRIEIRNKRTFFKTLQEDIEHYCIPAKEYLRPVYFLQDFLEEDEVEEVEGDKVEEKITTPSQPNTITEDIPHRYYTDLSILAEALCEDHPRYEKASKMVRQMFHLRWELEEWMPWWNSTTTTDNESSSSTSTLSQLQEYWMEQMVPIVLEPSFEFESQIDDAIRWVVNRATHNQTQVSLLPLPTTTTTNSVDQNNNKGNNNNKKKKKKNQQQAQSPPTLKEQDQVLNWVKRQNYVTCLDCSPPKHVKKQMSHQQHSSYLDKGGLAIKEKEEHAGNYEVDNDDNHHRKVEEEEGMIVNSTKTVATVSDPTTSPTAATVVDPTSSPTAATVVDPTTSPTAATVVDPTSSPTAATVVDPTKSPTAATVVDPTTSPTAATVVDPTASPTAATVVDPTTSPTTATVVDPTSSPTAASVVDPTSSPTAASVVDPTTSPTTTTVVDPTTSPTTTTVVDPTIPPTPATVVDPTTSPTTVTVVDPTIPPTPATVVDPTIPPTPATVVDLTTSPTMATVVDPTIPPTPATVVNQTSSPTAATIANPTSPPTVAPTTGATATTALTKQQVEEAQAPWEMVHHPPLSARGEVCATRFFRRDYETLQRLLDGGACKFKTCQKALQSILDRRREYLV